MESEEYYFNVPDFGKKESAINSLLSTFIAAREKTDFPTNAKGFDEDVNLYIAHLLYAVTIPNYLSITEQYVSLNDSEVRVLADMAEDTYLKYFIYKVNADNLLVHLGIYQDLAYNERSKVLHKTIPAYTLDAQNFYDQAAQLNRKIYRRKTAIADVLAKVSSHFESYCKALVLMRKEFFLFLNRFEDSEFCGFLDNMKTYEHRMELETKQNLFLDLYAQWLQSKSGELRSRINDLCKELQHLDPSFKFTIEE